MVQRKQFRTYIAFLLGATAVLFGGHSAKTFFYYTELCNEPADLIAFARECAEGSRYLAQIDPWTQAVFGVLRRFPSTWMVLAIWVYQRACHFPFELFQCCKTTARLPPLHITFNFVSPNFCSRWPLFLMPLALFVPSR
jgi:hypothetical protein